MEEIKILGKISQTTIEIIFSFPGNYTIAVQFFAKLRSHLSNYLRQYQVVIHIAGYTRFIVFCGWYSDFSKDTHRRYQAPNGIRSI